MWDFSQANILEFRNSFINFDWDNLLKEDINESCRLFTDKTRLGQLGANISPDRSSLTPQVLIGNFLKHNYPLLYELQHINLLCLYLPKKMVYPQTPNT